MASKKAAAKKPAKAKADTVIVTRRPILKEPDAKPEDKTPNLSDDEQLKSPSERATKLEGKLHMPNLPVEAETEAPAKEAPKPAEEPIKKDEAPGPPIVAEAAKHDDEDEEAIATKQQYQADVRKLIESKKYALPINAVEKRRAKHVVVLGVVVSVLLLLAWVNIALDAGLIEIPGVRPLTHFFST